MPPTVNNHYLITSCSRFPNGTEVVFAFNSNRRVLLKHTIKTNNEFVDITDTIGTNNFPYDLDGIEKAVLIQFSEQVLRYIERNTR